ncbi:hypothetical protein BDA96_06G178500 [Sorghum bicolor]|uniref:Uncharacterized protein n=2 Tax=Sorghum bicolor TaxID=4558 RepID=A0A921UCB4_SORBI|nr:uncharacterized protein LOC8083330 isoform X2 [Sorghum bicolor]KAG0526812.1 hypothetical protein BDA96_06G178500 [Sorghum bicolor]KXG26792.1 hypothetical protein SORBI_3006G162300 [Sorghum bicolor]|eukprot:XP_021317932.1 uncharacterized protein LOC8083330 isoform X2 [Sorghum bicolor]
MPPPAEPFPSVTAGLSEQEAADADPDFLYFLRHVRLDGDAYTVVIPPEDGAASPPWVIRYEQPVPDHNAGTPVAGSECGAQRGPPSSEDSPRATSEAPRGEKRKAPDASPGGEVSSGAVPMEEDTTTPVAESAWFDSQPDIDEDYRFFLRHVREVEGKLVFKTGNCSITIGEGYVDHSDAEDDDDSEEEVEEGEEEEDDEVGNTASGQSGQEGIGTEEEDDEEEAIPASVTEVKEEEVSKEEDDDVGPVSDIQIVNEPVYYETKKVEEGGEKPLNALVRGTTDLDPLGKKEASSSKAMPLNASELQGVIWPPHINDRPNSMFKEKLIEFLIKPFTQEEYDKYFALATDRRPLLKERRTRNKVAYYPWTHEMNKSYFDRYPDLAEQFNLQRNNYPNGLALLRGLFFWLQNIGQEDQFRPWSDEFKKYRVVPFVE